MFVLRFELHSSYFSRQQKVEQDEALWLGLQTGGHNNLFFGIIFQFDINSNFSNKIQSMSFGYTNSTGIKSQCGGFPSTNCYGWMATHRMDGCMDGWMNGGLTEWSVCQGRRRFRDPCMTVTEKMFNHICICSRYLSCMWWWYSGTNI